MDRKIKNSLDKIESRINFFKYDSLSSLENELPYDFNNIFNREFSPHGDMAVLLSNFNKKINECLKIKITELKKLYKKYGIENDIIFNRIDSFNELDVNFNKEIEDAFDEMLKEKLPSWWLTHLFTWHKTSRNKAKGISSDIIILITQYFNDLITEIKDNTKKSIDANYEFIGEQNRKSMQQKQDLLGQDKKEKEKQKEILSKEIKELSVKIENIKQKQREFKKKCERL